MKKRQERIVDGRALRNRGGRDPSTPAAFAQDDKKGTPIVQGSFIACSVR